MPRAQAVLYHGHCAKRFLLNLAEDSPEFSEVAAVMVGADGWTDESYVSYLQIHDLESCPKSTSAPTAVLTGLPVPVPSLVPTVAPAPAPTAAPAGASAAATAPSNFEPAKQVLP